MHRPDTSEAGAKPIRVTILGSTGSIGRQALDVVRTDPGRFEVAALVAGRDEESLAAQCDEFGVAVSGVGERAATELAGIPGADVVLNAIVGAAGLRASLAALEAGKTLALANKESLVAGGDLCLRAARASGARIVPVDSEHAAIAQCLKGRAQADVERIVLTASGGPFRTRSDLRSVTVDEALAHPTWSMGPKITIDSATLMNKGLEVIEARYLFGLDYDRIGVIVHPQSVVHGIVEMRDGSSLLQAAPADMRIPIRAALTGAEGAGERRPIDLPEVSSLQFEELDHERFPAVGLAVEAGRRGKSYPAVLNAANESAVKAFLGGEIAFIDIVPTVERVLDLHDGSEAGNLDALLEVDSWARRETAALMRGASGADTSGR